MKGIICAGGKGTRLYPLTRATNKHLLPIYNKPMIYYPIQTLVNTGIKDILIVVSEPHSGDFINVLRNGEEFGLKKVEYAFQDESISGISGAISCGGSFADNDNIVVILGDNTTDADIKKDVENFKKGAKVFLKQVDNPNRFGVPVFDENKNILTIEEKPKNPKSNYGVTGLYIYDNTVFERIKKLKPSARGELEVTDLNNSYIEDNLLEWSELPGFWNDAGTFESLFLSNQYWANKER
ncbi:spore coat protein [candidate division WWE3 bacterium]|jgi:glucose-1-phosphate thymidylyltransferase|uniref:glucose-1-phosphate thymidylyltransferase n=1 Tax=candidate division WWE3 bacterium TaxID=2053526 RepID=A0A3A4ZB32_UNCKA|nr:MAG: spore coat protein [candidate division WWE3 bacterium]